MLAQTRVRFAAKAESGMKVGDVANAEAAGNGKPLDGIRVLALEQMQALPYATQLLARLGAEVVKVEPPTGESGRGSLPGMRDPYDRLVGATFLRNNLSKRSVAIDLKNPAGRDLVLRLAPRFDVVAENFKPGTARPVRASVTPTSPPCTPPSSTCRCRAPGTSSSRPTPSGPRTRRWPRRCRASTSTPAPRASARAPTRSAPSATSAPRCSR